ncbi:MAG: DUF4386 family protein [Candidatus Bathyarchaeia archaeon]|jgi:hypothetical protein
MKAKTAPETNMHSAPWRNLYLVGAVAAFVAALVFRRNLGAAEIPMFFGLTAPTDMQGWFTLLQSNPLLGLSFLNVFDIIDYALVGVMLVALYIALRQTSRGIMTIAVSMGFVGIILYFVSNNALPLLALSNQYAAASEAQKASLVATGDALLANGYNPGALYPSAAIYVSLLLIAVAGLLVSAVMWQSKKFGKVTAAIGAIACLLDLTYCAGLFLIPTAGVYVLSVACLASAGFFLMLWHLLIGFKLYKLSKKPTATEVTTIE